MGIYCIAAGSASTNRLKTLDRAHSIADIEPYLPSRDLHRLRQHFPDGRSVFIWGANRQGQLPRVRAEEYVIDFNDQRVQNVFRFCFFTFTGSDVRLQEFVGWDEDRRSTIERRPYPYVYFLKNPVRPRDRNKQFFLKAFGATRTPHFFDAQKYLDDQACAEAMRRARVDSLEAFLGLPPGPPDAHPQPQRVSEPSRSPLPASPPPPSMVDPPAELRPVIAAVERLWERPHSLEREHEHAVALFLEALGYRSAEEIRFQHSDVDILLVEEGSPRAVIEVKADRALVATQRAVVGQALGYAWQQGVPYVIISNGNYYAVFDRRSGLSQAEAMVGEFSLLSLDPSALATIEKLRKGMLK
jgi:Type I restriction enzyme R protein N terminus (HSDR_N)